MDRCGIFVDAGYLIAESAKTALGPTARRGDVAVDYRRLVERLCDRAREASGLPLLRVYWYDGALDGVPTTEQLGIGALPDVKLRLGRISGGRQKGVDALVYRDLTVLARERAIVTAFLLAGDEDLREGVASAQEAGVHVTLWGVGNAANQARTLKAEVDRCEHLAELGDPIAPAPGSQLALAAQTPATTGSSRLTTDEVGGTAADFARTWVAAATPEELGELLAGRPRIPMALDAELLRAVQARHGNLRGHDQLRNDVRAAFWSVVDEAAHRP